MKIRLFTHQFIGAALLYSFAISGAFAAPTGKITIAMPSEPATLDPAKGGTRYNHTFNANMFESLYIRNSQSDLVPGLAVSHTVSPDGLRYTFKLRRGVKFHDGSPLTADDIKFSFDRAMNPDTKNPLNAYLKAIDKVEIENPDTLAIKLKERDAILLKKLAFAGCEVFFRGVGEVHEVTGDQPAGFAPGLFTALPVHPRDGSEPAMHGSGCGRGNHQAHVHSGGKINGGF